MDEPDSKEEREEETDRRRAACAERLYLFAIEEEPETRRLRGDVGDSAARSTAQFIM